MITNPSLKRSNTADLAISRNKFSSLKQNELAVSNLKRASLYPEKEQISTGSRNSDRRSNSRNTFSSRQAEYIGTVINDMRLLHEGRPHGVPANYDWAVRPRVNMGDNSQGFKAFTVWGQLYEAAEGNPATNTRVQIKDIKAYFFSKKNQRWRLLQSSQAVEGSAYREDFADDISKPADSRVEPDGSVSVKAGGGYNFHFWTTQPRVSIDPQDIGGILTSVQARLVVDNPQQPDDRSQARYLLSMGADYWQTSTVQWSNFKTSNDVAISRFKYVRPQWQTFNMTTLSSSQLRRYPPPSNLFR